MKDEERTAPPDGAAILFVEDDELTRTEMGMFLALFYERVFTARDGKDGLLLYHEQQPDVVITDIRMPVMSGLSMAKSIRQTGADTPIIVTTAYNDTEYFLDSINIGINKYLQKPLDTKKLREAIDECLAAKKLRDALGASEERYRLLSERQALLIRELGRMNRDLDEFASIVSHDLKAPLRAIGFLARTLMDDEGGRMEEAGKEKVMHIMERTGKMSRLIDGILAYSRSTRGRSEKRPVDLAAEVPRIIDMLSPPVTVRVTIDDELPVVSCERTQIRQVFQNLVQNAIDFMDKPEGEVRITCRPGGDHWAFGVADNGPGIEERHFERIFKIFQTVRGGEHAAGSGIGLAIVKRIVEDHGGSVRVESEKGQGSTFLFTLPRHDVQGDHGAPPSGGGVGGAPGAVDETR